MNKTFGKIIKFGGSTYMNSWELGFRFYFNFGPSDVRVIFCLNMSDPKAFKFMENDLFSPYIGCSMSKALSDFFTAGFMWGNFKHIAKTFRVKKILQEACREHLCYFGDLLIDAHSFRKLRCL